MSAEVTRGWLESYAELEKRRTEKMPGWLSALRKGSLERFAEIGFPSARDEEWRATDLSALLSGRFQLPAPAPRQLPSDLVQRAAVGALEATNLVFVDGRFQPNASSQFSLPAGVKLVSLAQAMREMPEVLEKHFAKNPGENGSFAALNHAFFEDGALLLLPPQAAVEKPIHLIFFSSGDGAATFSHPRVLVVAGEGSKARLVESHLGLGERYFSNSVTEIEIGPGAQIEHLRLQREQAGAYHIGRIEVQVGRNGRFSSFALSKGAALSRLDLSVKLAGEGAECGLDGLMLGSGSQQLDVHSKVSHLVPHGTSRQLYKAVLGGTSRAVFNGRVVVCEGAQKTDASQKNRNLLLTPEATVYARPQLEIYADDVKCSHGSATGQLDAESVFYLRSRGIGEAQARQMLTEAFAADVLSRIEPAELRQSLRELALAGMFSGPGKERA